MRLRYLCASLLFVLAAHAAGDSQLERATLRGLGKVGVVIDPTDDDLVQQGLSPGTLQARVEEGLRAAGVPVDVAAPEFVGVRLMRVRDKRGPYAVCITVGLYQQVTITRDPKIKSATQTWEVQTVLMADQKQLYRGALDSLDELLKSFGDAWTSVNPKK
jgi:hypothetical protein